MDFQHIISLLGGVALFLFGMSVMGDSLKKVTGSKMEMILYKLSGSTFKGILLGTGVTAVIQSSSATSVMTVGFVNSGIMKVKQREFLALTQGSMSVGEYLNKFNNLARYSTHDVSTEERKIDRFLGGLNHALRCQLCMLDFPDFQTLINKALIAEREHKSGYDDRKRKFEPKKETHVQFA